MRACPQELLALRKAALYKGAWHGIPALPLIDAATWQASPSGEDWLTWRARRVARRLEQMPIEIGAGERIVGRPECRPPTSEEGHLTAVAQESVLSKIPAFPGGDAGHFHPDYETPLRIGLGGMQQNIVAASAKLVDVAGTDACPRDTTPTEQRIFYDACRIALEGASTYARRVAEACDKAAVTAGGDEAARWLELAHINRRVATEPPATFHEAIQLMFLIIVALWCAEDHGLTSPGRMDRTLRSFYEADLAAGLMTADNAFELICALYIQLNMICQPGAAIAVMIGGLDAEGNDATCELSYLCLEAREATRLVYPTVGLAWHEGTPGELTDFACRMLSTGIGCPAFFNDEVISRGLQDNGVTRADSHNYVNSTCVEIKVAGASNIWVTAPYFNCPQALLDVLDDVQNGSTTAPFSFQNLNERVRARLSIQVADAARMMDKTWRQRAVTGGFPLASCFIRDCLARGRDYDRGGARYNWVENSFVGLANLVDSLHVLKRLVYEAAELTLEQFCKILKTDFDGEEPLRRRIARDVPSYGTDNDEVDVVAVEWATFLSDASLSHQVGGHAYVPGFFCWIVHAAFGTQTGATPDGRKAGLPLADGAGAAQGRETGGPTASILSTTKWSHQTALGGIVHNLRLSSSMLRTESELAAFRGLIETYLRRGGFEIQVNVVDTATLRHAQKHPEEHRDLIVRVAGYSDYFTHLTPVMQEEIISRNEHG